MVCIDIELTALWENAHTQSRAHPYEHQMYVYFTVEIRAEKKTMRYIYYFLFFHIFVSSPSMECDPDLWHSFSVPST